MEHKTCLRGPAIAGAAALGLATTALLAPAAHAGSEVERPDEFTSAYMAWAVPNEVVDDDGPAPGEPRATGEFMLWINSDLEVICFDIELDGVTGDYQSPAVTATHLHEAAPGEAGPPRLAFPDPEPVGDGPRSSSGCLEGPFVTGVEDDDGNDQGEGFTVAQIEEDPAAFFVDSHTEQHPAGAVRGQLTQVPLDGVDAGGGGTAAQSAALPVAGAGAAAVLLGLGAFMLFRRSHGKA